MLLGSLVDLYKVLAEEGKVDKPGWAKSKISYGLVVDESGKITSVRCYKTTNGKKELPVQLSLPMPVKKSVNIASNFLFGTASYIFGYDQKGKPERNRQCFEAAKELHLNLLADDDSDAAKAIKLYFEKTNSDNIQNYLVQTGCDENTLNDIFGKGANLVLMPFGRLATDFKDICDCWDKHYSESKSECVTCMITGEKLPVDVTHPFIKGVYGGQSMGTSLVSFNAPAFESFDKTQGYNSPVSEYAAFAYTTALNYLLSEDDYVNHVGDTTIVCWSEDDNQGCQGIMADIFGNDDNINQKDLWEVIHKLSQGITVDWNTVPVNPETKFFILGLSPNAARLSVRFFLVNTFGNFMKNAVDHEENMEIAVPKFIENSNFPVWKVLKETVNPKSKNKSAKPQLAGNYVYSILTGDKYPETLYDNIMIRIKAERSVSAEREAIRAAVIKAHLIRNYPEYKEVLTVSKNENTDNKAYNLGVLFSILEEIQSMANPDINSTIKDKYFTSASSTPAAVFPFIIDLAQKHLKKIKSKNPGFCIAKQKEITEILSKFDSYPARLTMAEKGVFQIGYYHQTQKRYTKKEDK